MEEARRFEKPGVARIAAAAGLMLASQIAAVWLGRHRPAETAVVESAAAVALGMAGIAALLVRHQPYPRWSYIAMAGILATAILTLPATSGSPEVWSEVHGILWMYPWYLILLGTLPVSKRGICATDHPRVGWLMIGTAILLGVILQLPSRLNL
jgi:hypothetical protein